MDLQILWEPEEGRCACCGAVTPKVRSFTHGGKHERLCFGCWHSMDPSEVVLSSDWNEAVTITFEIGAGKADSRRLN